MPRTNWDYLLDTAQEVFARAGFHAVGVDELCATAKASKVSLYRHFKSKDRLIGVVLERYSSQWREWFFDDALRRAPDPAGRLLALFDVLADWRKSPDFRGCLFQLALAEFPDPKHPARKAALAHRREIRKCLKGLARGVRGADYSPEELTRVIALLLDGAIAAAAAGDAKAPQRARALAATLLTASKTGDEYSPHSAVVYGGKD